MKSISTIVVPLDLSALSEVAFHSACGVAELFGAKRLHLLHVVQVMPYAIEMVDYAGPFLPDTLDAVEQAAKAQLARFSCGEGRIEIARETRIGNPAREIVRTAEERGGDLIVLATANRGAMGRLLLGSVAHTVVRASNSPVLVVAEDRPWKRPGRIVAAIDLSPISERVVSHAIAFGRAAQCEVDVFSAHDLAWVAPIWTEYHPLPLDEEQRMELAQSYRASIEGVVAKVGDPDVPTTTTVIRSHPPAKLIVDHAKEIDAALIVLGSSGHSAWERLVLGSTATKVLSRAHCPVLVVPSR